LFSNQTDSVIKRFRDFDEEANQNQCLDETPKIRLNDAEAKSGMKLISGYDIIAIKSFPKAEQYLSKEFTANTERTKNLSCSLASAPDQLYLVTLELMADPSGGVLEAQNTKFEAAWGDATTLVKLVTQPVTLNEDARSVRLSWSGTGVSFMVSTDSGKTWESVANGKATALRNPGNQLVLKAMLQMAATTVLDSYSVEINPVFSRYAQGPVAHLPQTSHDSKSE
jgi:hypothetical protein